METLLLCLLNAVLGLSDGQNDSPATLLQPHLAKNASELKAVAGRLEAVSPTPRKAGTVNAGTGSPQPRKLTWKPTLRLDRQQGGEAFVTDEPADNDEAIPFIKDAEPVAPQISQTSGPDLRPPIGVGTSSAPGQEPVTETNNPLGAGIRGSTAPPGGSPKTGGSASPGGPTLRGIPASGSTKMSPPIVGEPVKTTGDGETVSAPEGFPETGPLPDLGTGKAAPPDKTGGAGSDAASGGSGSVSASGQGVSASQTISNPPNNKEPVSIFEKEGFVPDINNISPSATTDDQAPDASGTISFNARANEPVAILSIFQALDEALVKSPRAAALRAFLQIARAELARATEAPSPEFTYDDGVRAEQTRRTGVVINWEPPWKLIFRLIVAKRLVDQRKLELMAELWKLRAEVRGAYTEVVVAQETLETLNSLYDLAHRLRVVSEKRFQAGDVPELDLLKARLAESQFEVERRVGFRRVIRAKQQLNVILGRLPERGITIPRLPPFLKTADMEKAVDAKNPLLPDFTRQVSPLQYYLDLGLTHRYELKSLERQIAVNKASLTNAYGNIAPTGQFWMGSSKAGNPPSGPQLNAYYYGINIPSNLTSFQQGDIAQFKAIARQLKYQQGSVKNVITAEVSSAYNNLLAARQKLRIYEEHVLADSYEVARLARRSYEVGQSDITSTIQAQQNNVQIRTQYLEAIQLYQQAFTELERACGIPLLEADE